LGPGQSHYAGYPNVQFNCSPGVFELENLNKLAHQLETTAQKSLKGPAIESECEVFDPTSNVNSVYLSSVLRTIFTERQKAIVAFSEIWHKTEIFKHFHLKSQIHRVFQSHFHHSVKAITLYICKRLCEAIQDN
jgi:hypothetical protein